MIQKKKKSVCQGFCVKNIWNLDSRKIFKVLDSRIKNAIFHYFQS